MLEDELPNCHNQERVDEFAVRDGCCYGDIAVDFVSGPGSLSR